MMEAGLQEVKTYISYRTNTPTQFIVTKPIMDLCLEVERRPGSRVANRWFDKDALDLEGMRTEAWEAERTEGEEDTYGTETVTD